MTEQDASNNKEPIPIRSRSHAGQRRITLPEWQDLIDLKKEREKRKPSDFYREGI